jgi:hypothetical protein
MLQKALDLLAKSRRETKRLQEALREQMEITRELKEAVAKQEQTVHEMGKQMVEIKEQMTQELQRAREQLETIATNATDGPQRSYADVTRLTPFLPHNDSRTVAAPPNPTDVFYCTIDVSRLEEDEARLSAGTIRATIQYNTIYYARRLILADRALTCMISECSRQASAPKIPQPTLSLFNQIFLNNPICQSLQMKLRLFLPFRPSRTTQN